MKKHLRENFTIQLGTKHYIGPCEIELTEEEVALHEHKLESDDAPAPSKKRTTSGAGKKGAADSSKKGSAGSANLTGADEDHEDEDEE